MTYCLGIVTRFGLVMAADSRTNAGVDYISTYQKLFDFTVPGERVILLSTAGNLSMTQEILTILRRDLRAQAEISLHTLPNMYEIARYVGAKVRQVIETHRAWLKQDNIDYQCSLLLGGQVRGEETSLYLIYSQGNFLQATPETPFLQIGETKYGKPILDRTLSFETPIEAAAKYALLSLDSTMKSNISVGPPLDIVMYAVDSFLIQHRVQFILRHPFLIKIRKYWEASLRQVFDQMPDIEWDANTLEVSPPAQKQTMPAPAPLDSPDPEA
jgi:putative proteasome-type protease